MIFLAHEFILPCHHTFGYTVVVLLSCVWLVCDPMDCSLQGSSVHGILQARILGWAAISSSRESSWPRDQTHVSLLDRWILCHWAGRKPWVHCTNVFSNKLFIWSGISVQFSRSVMSDSATPWTAAPQASLSITRSGIWILIFVNLFMPSVSFWRNSPWTFWTLLGLNTTTDEHPIDKLWLVKREMHNFRV